MLVSTQKSELVSWAFEEPTVTGQWPDNPWFPYWAPDTVWYFSGRGGERGVQKINQKQIKIKQEYKEVLWYVKSGSATANKNGARKGKT